jgi:tRNA nucleotidyltransferase (CCA-adding enzyme)
VSYQQAVIAVSSALSPETWPFSLEWLPESACLVGGSVRDALLGRDSEYLDLDFVLPVGAVETAQAIARHYRAGYVLLDSDRQIARVVFKQGTADFAQQVGPTLEADLQRRDFRVNAIAYNPHTDQLLDPLQGYADLQKHMIRMVSWENLAEDPLRLLRAYRQAAQLGFSLEAETRSVIQQLAPNLRRIAAERVQSELNYLLSTARGTSWLTTAWQDGLLQDWFPHATAAGLALIAAIDQTTAILQETVPDFAVELTNQLRSTSAKTAGAETTRPAPSSADSKASGSSRTWLTAAKLASLLPFDSVAAEAQLRRLKYSRSEVQTVSTVIRVMPQLCAVAVNSLTDPAWKTQPEIPIAHSPRAQYLFFQEVGAAFPAVALLVIAAGVPLTQLLPLIHHFLTPNDPIAHPTPLLTGQDLMTALKLSAGPHIGRLLAEIQLARAEGKITNREEALQLAKVISAETSAPPASHP